MYSLGIERFGIYPSGLADTDRITETPITIEDISVNTISAVNVFNDYLSIPVFLFSIIAPNKVVKIRNAMASIDGNSGTVGVGVEYVVWVGFVVSVGLGEGSAV